MARKKSEFVSAFGVASEVIRAIANAVVDAGGSDADLASIRGNQAKLTAIAEIVVGKPAATSVPVVREEPMEATYTVFVNYVLLPMVDLKKSFDFVSELWDGRKWRPHDSLKGIAQTPGELVFFLKNFGKQMSSEAVIAWAEANGYRVANHLEALAFAQANPDIQRKLWYVALGSSAAHGDRQCVAYLSSRGSKRDLGDGWFGRDWLASTRFLLVRK
jgi:hypothetical protein